MFLLHIRELKLSDGSVAHDVVLREDDSLDRAYVFPACSERDALALVSKISEAVLAHTNEQVTVR